MLRIATQVIGAQQATYQGPDRPICHHQPATITRRLGHLLALPRFGLGRPYHLRQVRPLGLGLVAGGQPTLGYSALDHFLGDLEALQVAAPLGDALAQRYLELWPVPAAGAFFYLDNRRKVRYSGYPIAAGKISATDRILGATTQLFVHDAAGHVLYMRSGPGDDHLSRTLLPLVQHLVTLFGRARIRGFVADQEMRSVALFLALQALELGFVTIGRTPTPAQEAEFEIAGLFLPYRRDDRTGDVTHWVARAQTCLRDRPRGQSCEVQVTLLLDCRASVPGRLIPLLYDLPAEDAVPAPLPVEVYVGRWEAQERVFRDMRAGQNLDACYGHKKVAIPNRPQERRRAALQRKKQTLDKRVTTAQRKITAYAAQLATVAETARQEQTAAHDRAQELRQASRAAADARERTRLLRQADRQRAQQQVQQVRRHNQQRRLAARQRDWQQQLEKRERAQQKIAQALQACAERPLYDLNLEKDNLMTYLRMAGENAHRFVQERYFAGTLLEKVDEATMVRVVYNQPGWVRRRGRTLHLQLQGYPDAAVQAAMVQACQRVNQARIELPGGYRLQMEVSAKILRC